MPKVGEAWYDVEARTNRLRASLDDADHRILGSVQKAERGFGSRVTRAIGGIGSALTSVAKLGVGIGIAGVGGLAAIGGMAIKSAADMETMRAQWETLLGSTEKAQARMNELRQFAAETPFEIPEVMQASRTLQVFGGAALATGDNLRLVGDVAAGTNQPFSDVAMWVGRMYDAIKSGQPFGEAAQRLQEMGALSGENRRKIEKLAEGVKNGNVTMQEAWQQTTGTFSQFSGGMERMSQTVAGQWSNLMDNLGQTLAGIGELLLPLAKSVIEGFNAALPTIREFLIGVFEKAGPILQTVGGIFKQVIDGIGAAFDSNGQASNGFGKAIQAVAGIVQTVIAAWVENWPMIQEVVQNVMAVVGKVVATVMPLVGQAISWVATNVLPPLLDAFNGIATWVSENWPMISDVITQAAGLIGDAISVLWPILKTTGEVILPILGVAFQVLGPIIGFIIKAVRLFIGTLTKYFIPQVQAAGEAFSTIWQAVGGFFTNLWNGILQFFGMIVGNIIGIVKNVVGIAAEIPGPWQEGARKQRDALAGMEASVRSWGKSTTNTMDTTFADQLALARSGGAATGKAYADGLASQGGYLATTALDYAGKAAQYLEAHSPPKYGPLKDIRQYAERTADTYAEGWANRAASLRDTIGSVMAGVHPRVGVPAGALGGAGAASGAPVQVSFTFQSFIPPSPSQARAAIRAMVPELVPVLRQQRVLPRGG